MMYHLYIRCFSLSSYSIANDIPLNILQDKFPVRCLTHILKKCTCSVYKSKLINYELRLCCDCTV